MKMFNAIITKEYKITPSELVVRKDVISDGKTGEEIFTENGVSATIVETMPPDMRTLDGDKPVPCYVYRIVATKMSDEELAAAEKADAEAKATAAKVAAERLAKDKAAAEAALKATPPPPPLPKA